MTFICQHSPSLQVIIFSRSRSSMQDRPGYYSCRLPLPNQSVSEIGDDNNFTWAQKNWQPITPMVQLPQLECRILLSRQLTSPQVRNQEEQKPPQGASAFTNHQKKKPLSRLSLSPSCRNDDSIICFVIPRAIVGNIQSQSPFSPKIYVNKFNSINPVPYSRKKKSHAASFNYFNS